MMIHHVVRAPHPLMRRHGDQDLPAGRQSLAHGPQCRDIILDMFDHIENRDQIVMAGGNAGQAGQRRRTHVPAETLAGDLPGCRIDLDRLDTPELSQHRQVVSGTAADLQDACLRRQPTLAGQIIRQDVPPGAIPPMGGIMLGHAIVDAAIHIRRIPTSD